MVNCIEHFIDNHLHHPKIAVLADPFDNRVKDISNPKFPDWGNSLRRYLVQDVVHVSLITSLTSLNFFFKFGIWFV